MHSVNAGLQVLVSRTYVRVNLPDAVHQVATEHSQNGDHEGQQDKVETCTPTTAAVCFGRIKRNYTEKP